MSIFALLGALEIGLIFGLVALATLISFRILNFPDLTVDGSFTTGGAVAAVAIVSGVDPYSATLLAALTGALAGLLTGWLNVRLGIMNLLASILTMTGLYSINLRIMGVPNLSLLNAPTVFTTFQFDGVPDYWLRPAILVVIVVLVKLALDRFLLSQRGLALRATGSNARMARSQGISTSAYTLAGIALSNGLVALAGALFAQSQGGADISMGFGTIVIGLAAVIVGETIFPSRRIFVVTLAVIAGAILYRCLVAVALVSDFIGLQAQDLSVVTAVLVGTAMVLPKVKQKIAARRRGKSVHAAG
jgi:putative ABC transport system permease protein